MVQQAISSQAISSQAISSQAIGGVIKIQHRVIHQQILQATILALGMLLSFVSAAQAPIEALVKKCETCHGENGVGENPEVPIIAGFSYDGFIDTLAAFRDDERVGIEFSAPGEPDIVMNDIAKALSESEVEALAKHFSALEFIPAKQAFDAQLAAQGAKLHQKHCEKCHADGGGDPQDDAAILAGQWMVYIRHQFENIESGKRVVFRKMEKKIKALNAEDKQALLHFYGSNNLSAVGQ